MDELVLRNWQEHDADMLYEMCLDPELKKSGLVVCDSLEKCRNVVNYRMTDPDFKVLSRMPENQMIGFISLGDMNRYEGYRELEYAVAPQYRNRGYAVWMVNHMLDYGFKERGFLVIAAWVRSHNPISCRILEKCSFSLEGRLRKHGRDKSDTLCYSILREEWMK